MMRSYPGLLLKLLNFFFSVATWMLLKSAKVKRELQQFHNRRKTKLVSRILWFIFLLSASTWSVMITFSWFRWFTLTWEEERKKKKRESPSHLIRFTLQKRSLIGVTWEKGSCFLTQDWPHGNQILSLVRFQGRKFCKKERKTHCIIILGWIAAFTWFPSFGSFFSLSKYATFWH